MREWEQATDTNGDTELRLQSGRDVGASAQWAMCRMGSSAGESDHEDSFNLRNSNSSQEM